MSFEENVAYFERENWTELDTEGDSRRFESNKKIKGITYVLRADVLTAQDHQESIDLLGGSDSSGIDGYVRAAAYLGDPPVHTGLSRESKQAAEAHMGIVGVVQNDAPSRSVVFQRVTRKI